MNPLLQQALMHHQAQRLQQAEQLYRQVLAREPNNADALHLLGVIAMQVRQFEAAAQLIESAIRISPSVAMYHNNLGNVCKEMRKIGEAEACYRQALALKPDYADAQVNLGTILREMARFGEAVAAYERAIQIAPKLADAHASLGTVLKDQGRIEESLAAYRRAIELDHKLVDAHSNLLYAMHCSDQITPAQMFKEHLAWAELHAKPLMVSARPHANKRSLERRLRIGYVSADFRDHPVARFLWPLIEHRDREKFEVVCFSGVAQPDAVTQQYRSAVDEWHDTVALSDEQLAELIRSRRIDVLVDLTGHTGGTRLLTFARKPAPVQLSYLGYPDTTGVDAIDFRITDALADPIGADKRHVERLARVEGCFLCYPLPEALPHIAPPPAQSTGHITFGSFNNLSKISQTAIRLWSDVLASVPGSRMIIKTTTLGDDATRAAAVERFALQGLPMDRVTLLGPTRLHQDHLDAYRSIDIALDTFPYCGTTTTCEALAMGVPVISLVGEHHASRVGLSLLAAAGFGQWATNDSHAYVGIARQLAADIERLAGIRSGLRDAMARSILCDARGFARKIETTYRDG